MNDKNKVRYFVKSEEELSKLKNLYSGFIESYEIRTTGGNLSVYPEKYGNDGIDIVPDEGEIDRIVVQNNEARAKLEIKLLDNNLRLGFSSFEAKDKKSVMIYLNNKAYFKE